MEFTYSISRKTPSGETETFGARCGTDIINTPTDAQAWDRLMVAADRIKKLIRDTDPETAPVRTRTDDKANADY